LYRPRTSSPGTAIDPRRNQERVPITFFNGGNEDLDPEKSHSFTAGFQFDAQDFAGLRLTGSYWEITQQQRVELLSTIIILANESLFGDRVVRAAPTAADVAAGLPGQLISIDATSVNFGRLETSGIDMSASMTVATEIGTFRPYFSGTWVSRYKAADVPGAAPTNRVGVANIQGTIPEWRATATLSWQTGPVTLAGTARYRSSYADVGPFNNIPNGRRVPSETLFDLQLSMDIDEIVRASWARGLNFRIGAINLFDKGPPFALVGSGYDESQADTRQRFIYASLRKTF
jgi:iron complex outermembrane receptor protein